MLNITEEYIKSIAPNQNAVTNGLGLVKKNSFVKLNVSEDETVLFGECKGSGASNYSTSADFIKQDSPVFRCSCPSRQFPCKHSIGLLFAYVNGKSFVTADIPEDIVQKREKIEKKDEKKKVEATKAPKKVNKTALKKKLAAQLEGLELLEKIIGNFVQGGLGTMNVKTVKMMGEQIKQLGNYYLPGPQIMLREFLLLFENSEKLDQEKMYSLAIDKLISLNALCKKGKLYLSKRLDDIEAEVEQPDLMAGLLGQSWQLSELKEMGAVEYDAELIQLAFDSYADAARMEYVDCGVWLNMKSGALQKTLTYRPFKAVKYIREDDAIYSVTMVKEMFVYPGELNPRIRWESMELRDAVPEDYVRIKAYAKDSYAEVIKIIKNQIKNPLSNKNPLALVNFAKIGKAEGSIVIEDEKGQRLVIKDGFEQANTHILEIVDRDMLARSCMLVRFWHDAGTGKLRVQPLSLITADRIIRLRG